MCFVMYDLTTGSSYTHSVVYCEESMGVCVFPLVVKHVHIAFIWQDGKPFFIREPLKQSMDHPESGGRNFLRNAGDITIPNSVIIQKTWTLQIHGHCFICPVLFVTSRRYSIALIGCRWVCYGLHDKPTESDEEYLADKIAPKVITRTLQSWQFHVCWHDIYIVLHVYNRVKRSLQKMCSRGFGFQ